LVVVAASTPIAPVGTREGGVLLVILAQTLQLGLFVLSVLVVDSVLEISVVVEVCPQI
jgi:hypothetical protein